MAHLRGKSGHGPCPRIVLAAFGGLFLITLYSVPVTTSKVAFRRDAGSLLVFRTTYPENSTMFLPSYLAAKAGPKGGEVRLRSAQWFGTMAVIVVLGVFDSFALCRMLRRSRRRKDAAESDADGSDAGSPPSSSGLSLFP